jgi:hypothetical protein
MTTQPDPTPHTPDAATDALPPPMGVSARRHVRRTLANVHERETEPGSAPLGYLRQPRQAVSRRRDCWFERPEQRGPAERRLPDHPGEADVCSGIAADRARECSTASERQPTAIPPPWLRMSGPRAPARRRSYFRISRLR